MSSTRSTQCTPIGAYIWIRLRVRTIAVLVGSSCLDVVSAHPWALNMLSLDYVLFSPNISSCDTSVIDNPLPHAHHERLPQNALLEYDAVGIFEEWDLSMYLFDATIASPVQAWASNEPANPGPQSPRRQALLRWAHSSPAIREAVAGDLLLYDLAVSIFYRQTAEALGVDWENERAS